MPSYIDRSTIYRLKTAIKNDTECKKTFDGFMKWDDLCHVYDFNQNIIYLLNESYRKIFEITEPAGAPTEGSILIRLQPLAKRLMNNGILEHHECSNLPNTLFHGTSERIIQEIQISGFLYPGIDGFINFSDTAEKAIAHAKKKYPEEEVRILVIDPEILFSQYGCRFYYYHGLFRCTERIDVHNILIK